MKWHARIALLVLLTGLTACGYHAPGEGSSWRGGAGKTVYVELFANRTVEPYLDTTVTGAVLRQLSRSRLFELVEDREKADLLLSGNVTGFSDESVAYNSRDEITVYRARLTAEAVLVRRSDGAVLWRGTLQRSEDHPSLVDKSLQQEGQSLAGEVAAQRLAEDLMARLLDDF